MKEERPHQKLANDSLQHLQREAALLCRMSTVVNQVRADLLAKNADTIQNLASRQSELLAEQKTIKQARTKLRGEIATTLGIPHEEATVLVFSAQCSFETRNEIVELCGQLETHAKELNATLIANGNLAFQLWELLERVFRALGGDQPVPQVYQRNGQRRAA